MSILGNMHQRPALVMCKLGQTQASRSVPPTRARSQESMYRGDSDPAMRATHGMHKLVPFCTLPASPSPSHTPYGPPFHPQHQPTERLGEGHHFQLPISPANTLTQHLGRLCGICHAAAVWPCVCGRTLNAAIPSFHSPPQAAQPISPSWACTARPPLQTWGTRLCCLLPGKQGAGLHRGGGPTRCRGPPGRLWEVAATRGRARWAQLLQLRDIFTKPFKSFTTATRLLDWGTWGCMGAAAW